MDLIITPRLVIPSKELKWRFSKASGPGGQKINKTNTRVEIIFNIQESKVLNDYQKKVLTNKLKTKLVNNCFRFELFPLPISLDLKYPVETSTHATEIESLNIDMAPK